MPSPKRRAFALCLTAATLSLAGCDDEPNPDFERQMEEQKAAQAGDPYTTLDQVPRQSRLARYEPALQRSQAGQYASELRAGYETMLEKLDAEPQVAAIAELAGNCRKSFEDSLVFHADAGLNSEEAGAQGSALNARLNQCRDDAIAAQDGGDEAVQARAALLRRFSSTAMVLVGAAAMAKGAEEDGRDIWSKGEALVAQDRPGFTIRPEMFRN